MSTVLYEQAGKIVTITINRPDAMNAIDPETQDALVEAWTRFRDDDGAWVAILTGAGEKSFCAGADLKKMIPASSGKGGRRSGHESMGLGGITRGSRSGSHDRRDQRPLPAGGMEQALACGHQDLGAAREFRLPEGPLGIFPGAGGTQRLPRTFVRSGRPWRILMAKTLTAEEAWPRGARSNACGAGGGAHADGAHVGREHLRQKGAGLGRAAKERSFAALTMPLPDGLRWRRSVRDASRDRDASRGHERASRRIAHSPTSRRARVAPRRVEAPPRRGARAPGAARVEPERPDLSRRCCCSVTAGPQRGGWPSHFFSKKSAAVPSIIRVSSPSRAASWSSATASRVRDGAREAWEEIRLPADAVEVRGCSTTRRRGPPRSSSRPSSGS